MRIFTRSTITPCRRSWLNIFRPTRLRKMPKDTVDFVTDKSVSCFKHIKLKTAEKMYNTKFTPSDKDYGEYAYKTFVLDSKTQEPVEVLVCPKILNNVNEEYYILTPNKVSETTQCNHVSDLVYVQLSPFINYDKTKDMFIVGSRSFSYDEKTKEILSGSMTSYGREEFSGLGIIEHQIAIERMLMNKSPELKIYSLPSAYQFHKDCGFEVVKSNICISKKELKSIINDYSSSLDLDKRTIKSLLIYRKKLNGDYIFDKNSTSEQIVKYLKANNRSLYGMLDFSMDMRLTKEALEEWKLIIKRNPILIGKNLEGKVV